MMSNMEASREHFRNEQHTSKNCLDVIAIMKRTETMHISCANSCLSTAASDKNFIGVCFFAENAKNVYEDMGRRIRSGYIYVEPVSNLNSTSSGTYHQQTMDKIFSQHLYKTPGVDVVGFAQQNNELKGRSGTLNTPTNLVCNEREMFFLYRTPIFGSLIIYKICSRKGTKIQNICANSASIALILFLIIRRSGSHSEKARFPNIDIEQSNVFYEQMFDGLLKKVRVGMSTVVSMLDEICRVVEFPIAESFLILAEVLLEIKEAFLTVCCQQPLDNPIEILTEQQWSMLDNVVKLLSLFRTHINVIQDGNYATIDRVVPSLMQLQMSLYKDFPLLGDLPTKLKQDLLSRTAYILDPNSENFDGTWIQATALNPQLAMLLDDTQTVYAKSAIEKMLYEKIRIAEETMARRNGLKAIGGVDALLAAVVERKSSTTSSIAQCSTPSAVSPPLSSSSSTASTDNGNCSSNATSMLYPDLMQAAHQRRKLVQEKQQNGKNLYAEAMVQAYFKDLVHSKNPRNFDAVPQNEANRYLKK